MTLPILRIKCHPMSPQQRRLIIKENIFKTNYQGLANLCGVTKRTIIRDVNQWRQDGGFEESLIDEFVSTYPNIKQQFPDKAFDRLCYLIGRQMTRKIDIRKEVKTEHKTEVSVLIEKYETVITRASNRNIQNDNP